jgi:hypothetical protein
MKTTTAKRWRTRFENEWANPLMVMGLIGVALCLSGVAGFVLLAMTFSVNPHPHIPLLVMGIVSFVLAAAMPSLWWIIAIAIALLPATILMTDPWLLAETLFLAFGPALLGYWVASLESKKKRNG